MQNQGRLSPTQKSGRTSPKKAAANPRPSQSAFADAQAQKKEFAAMEIYAKETQIKNEHYANTLIGLNNKLLAYNDMVEDVKQHKSMLSKDEEARTHL